MYDEQHLTISQVCRRFPGARGARHVTPSTVTRWIVAGCPSRTGERVRLAATRVGGRWYSKHKDGSEANTGYVLTYQPYDLLVLAWQIDGDFKCNPDLVTEVVVEFIPESSKHTRVKFEHKDLHKLGSGKTVESMDKGWGDIMNLYKQFTDQ